MTAVVRSEIGTVLRDLGEVPIKSKKGEPLPGWIALPLVAALVLVAGGVHAEALYPMQGKTVDLGAFSGTVYYTIQPDGYRVVATLGTQSPVRFIATLSPEQSILLSIPRGLGEPAIQVHIVRHGKELLVDDGTNSP